MPTFVVQTWTHLFDDVASSHFAAGNKPPRYDLWGSLVTSQIRFARLWNHSHGISKQPHPSAWKRVCSIRGIWG